MTLPISSADLDAIAEQTGFQPEPLEKTIWLLHILKELAAHEALRGCFALTGGTALHLFHMPFPSRLSEDIDLQWRKPDSSGNAVQRMHAVLQDVCQQNGLELAHRRNPFRATQTWQVLYPRTFRSDLLRHHLRIDVNFGSSPILEPEIRHSCTLGDWQIRDVPVTDVYEMTASKCVALMARMQPRDFYDVYEIQHRLNLDIDRLQQMFLAVGVDRAAHWDRLAPAELDFDVAQLRSELLPLLGKPYEFSDAALQDFGDQRLNDVKEFAERLCSFTPEQAHWLDARLEGRSDLGNLPPLREMNPPRDVSSGLGSG